MYCESNWGELMNQLSRYPIGFTENRVSGETPFRQSLVLDGEKGELVKSSVKLGKKIEVSETKTIAALKSHSEAERRRREKINAHFTSLRGLVPDSEKMDKAALLAEVISQVKKLKTTAKQASEGLHIPMDTDEVEVEVLDNNNNAINGSFLLRVSLCCEYRPYLLSEVRQALNNLRARILESEISTLGGRVKTVFVVTTEEETNENAVRSALSNVLDKLSASAEYDQELFFPRKRQRVSCVDSL
ncbi:hypothetical protein ABFS83_08G135600 [Erythranthe nasuta]